MIIDYISLIECIYEIEIFESIWLIVIHTNCLFIRDIKIVDVLFPL